MSADLLLYAALAFLLGLIVGALVTGIGCGSVYKSEKE